MPNNPYLAEFIGTFALVFVGCGAIIVNDNTALLGHLGVSLCFGLVVMTMIYAMGNVSGAHFNPAVSLAFVVAGRLPLKMSLLYMVSQCLGALSAASTLAFLFPDHPSLGATQSNTEILHAFIIEIVFTFFLMFVILNVASGHKEKGMMAGVAIGGTISFAALVAGPLTGASMNPIRSLAPALVSDQWQDLWIYLIAPFIGASIAIPICRCVQGKACCYPTLAENKR